MNLLDKLIILNSGSLESSWLYDLEGSLYPAEIVHQVDKCLKPKLCNIPAKLGYFCQARVWGLGKYTRWRSLHNSHVHVRNWQLIIKFILRFQDTFFCYQITLFKTINLIFNTFVHRRVLEHLNKILTATLLQLMLMIPMHNFSNLFL